MIRGKPLKSYTGRISSQIQYIRRNGTKSTGGLDLSKMLRQTLSGHDKNGNDNNSTNSTGTVEPLKQITRPKIPTFTSNEWEKTNIERGIMDLSSVSTMNTILGILDDAQRSDKHKQSPPRGDSLFNLSVSADSKAVHADISDFKKKAATKLGEDILNFAIIRYLNDAITPLDIETKAKNNETFNELQEQIRLQFLTRMKKKSPYGNNAKLTLNGILNPFQAISMHFIKRPKEGMDQLEGEINLCVSNDPNLESKLISLGKYKSNLQFDLNFEEELVNPEIDQSERESPTVIHPIYANSSSFLEKLPFILNEERILKMVLRGRPKQERLSISNIMNAQAREGSLLFDIFVRSQLLRTKSKMMEESCAHRVVKATVAARSNLLSKANVYPRLVSRGFADCDLDEEIAVHHLSEQFNSYLSVWYRLNPDDASKWCGQFVHSQATTELTDEYLSSLQDEVTSYFLLQTRNHKCNAFIKTELESAQFVRDILDEDPTFRYT
ncbi:hypothetical protein CAAN1_03S03906 [[Candida] anglica]|uniref:Uncharacterized protein n=1 Tax=[Candida] anglica TaxID=148631 RepID=A0ABP0EGY7_9ASCO